MSGMVCHFCFAHIKVIATNFSIFPGLYVWCKWIRSPTMWNPTCPVENPTCFNSNIFSSNRCLTDRPMFDDVWCFNTNFCLLDSPWPMFAHGWLNPHVSCLNPLVFPSETLLHRTRSLTPWDPRRTWMWRSGPTTSCYSSEIAPRRRCRDGNLGGRGKK